MRPADGRGEVIALVDRGSAGVGAGFHTPALDAGGIAGNRLALALIGFTGHVAGIHLAYSHNRKGRKTNDKHEGKK